MLPKFLQILFIMFTMTLFFGCGGGGNQNDSQTDGGSNQNEVYTANSIINPPKIVEVTATSSTTAELHWLPASSKNGIEKYEIYGTTQKGKELEGIRRI